MESSWERKSYTENEGIIKQGILPHSVDCIPTSLWLIAFSIPSEQTFRISPSSES